VYSLRGGQPARSSGMWVVRLTGHLNAYVRSRLVLLSAIDLPKHTPGELQPDKTKSQQCHPHELGRAFDAGCASPLRA
jgi:hypothetical protein